MSLISASQTRSLAGVWVPIITPFLEQTDRPVDHAALGLLAKRLQAAAVHGLVVGGTTGEAFALSNAERLACWHTIASHAPHVPLMLGTGGASLSEALADMAWLADAQRTQGLPLHAVLLAAPAYVRPSVAGLEHWFCRLADAAPAPVVVYDIPYRTGAVLPRDLLLRLATHRKRTVIPPLRSAA
jgi:4-hydroxy-tetrahydrodipicolinate synthase